MRHTLTYILPRSLCRFYRFLKLYGAVVISISHSHTHTHTHTLDAHMHSSNTHTHVKVHVGMDQTTL